MSTSLKKKQKNWVGRLDEEEKIPVVSSGSGSGSESNFHAERKQQYLGAFVATIASFSLGQVLGWSAPALADLDRSQDLGVLTSEEKSWIASLAVLGALISGPIVGYLINTKCGRKYTSILLAFPFFIGWMFIAFSQNIYMMYSGRFLTGFSGGAYTVIVPVYISEIAEDKLRGVLGSTMVLSLVTGILFTFSVAAAVSWFWLSCICAVFPVIFIISMLCMPETPFFLLRQGQTARAYESLRYFRGATNLDQIEPEMTKLRDSVENNNNTGGTSILAFKKPSVFKPTGISLMLMFFQQLGGINAICFYTVQILKAANPNFDANVSSIIIGIVQVCFVGVSMILVDKLGRKTLLFISLVIMSLSLTSLATFFYMKYETETNTHSTSMAFVPLISLISFIIAYSAGAGPLPWLIMSEIIPPQAKGVASGLVTSFYWFLAFLATKTFDNLIELLTEYGCYYLYAGICATGALFVLFFVPETKGLTYAEISQKFKD